MASISTDPNGNRLVQFVGADRKRKTVRLGNVPLRFANEVKLRIELLNAAKVTGLGIDSETAATAWSPPTRSMGSPRAG